MKITQHPVNKSTELPASIYKRRNWKALGYYNDHLTIGHYLSSLFGDVEYLILKTGYGTLADALIDNKRNIVATDDDESEILTMSSAVRQSFRVANVISPAQKLGQFDVIISPGLNDFDDIEDLKLFAGFIDRHKPILVWLLIDQLKLDLDNWKSEFIDLGFEYQESLVKTMQIDLEFKLKVLTLKNLIIFSKEREHAWCREDA